SAEPQHSTTAPAHRKDEAELVPPKQITAGGMASALAAFYAAVRRASAPNHCTQPMHPHTVRTRRSSSLPQKTCY
ncbi:hypothetical protein, partial [Lentimonas sp. CC19]|uniref:hypothetical protein n=1 Tax=Lentimonas sp. CC19 TaxID=2676097 RepID=UPI001A7ED5F1